MLLGLFVGPPEVPRVSVLNIAWFHWVQATSHGGVYPVVYSLCVDALVPLVCSCCQVRIEGHPVVDVVKWGMSGSCPLVAIPGGQPRSL